MMKPNFCTVTNMIISFLDIARFIFLRNWKILPIGVLIKLPKKWSFFFFFIFCSVLKNHRGVNYQYSRALLKHSYDIHATNFHVEKHRDVHVKLFRDTYITCEKTHAKSSTYRSIYNASYMDHLFLVL